MTKFGSIVLACPKCGNRQETMVWDSINVGLNPELREKLFKDEINIFKCELCNTIAFIGHPLLYNDMKRNYCVQYFPPEFLKDESFLRQYSRDGRLKMEESIASISEVSRYLLTPHIVFDLNEMVHYIEFRERLFDIYEDWWDIGLKIASDQQEKIDQFMKRGAGLNDISIHSQIDCPEYRNLFKMSCTNEIKTKSVLIVYSIPSLLTVLDF